MYDYRSRLKHASNRLSQVNSACGTYITPTHSKPITVSPILISATEYGPGGEPSMVRAEYQDFVLWVCDKGPHGEIGLGTFYPPEHGHKIQWNNQTFTIIHLGRDDPPYLHVDSDRDRIIVHTVRTAKQ